MILHKMTDQELVRLTALTGWQIPLVAEQTGLPQSMVADVLLVSTYLLVREQGRRLSLSTSTSTPTAIASRPTSRSATSTSS